MGFRILFLIIWAALHLSTVSQDATEIQCQAKASIAEMCIESEIFDQSQETFNHPWDYARIHTLFFTAELAMIERNLDELNFHRLSLWKEKRSSGLAPPIA